MDALGKRLFVLGFPSLIVLGAALVLWFVGRSALTYLPPAPRTAALWGTPRKPKPPNYGPARTLLLEKTQVPVTNTMGTDMAFIRKSGPPWVDGNYLTFRLREPQLRDGQEVYASWQVLNMHAENFGEITRRLNLSSVEVRVVHMHYLSATNFTQGSPSGHPFLEDCGYALVTDSRIPREWFLARAGQSVTQRAAHTDLNTGAVLEQAYPQFFRASE